MAKSTKSGDSNRWRALTRWPVTIGASTALLATMLLIPSTAAWAQDENESEIIVNTAGDRDLDGGFPLPLEGVILHLRLQDGTEIDEGWATCTSLPNGLCTFTVPDTGDGGANEGVTFLVVQEEDGVPDGWFANTDLRIGGALGNSIPAEYEFPVGPLEGGQTYESGLDFMSGAPNFRTSSGVWQQSRENPPLPVRCGLNVALVMDLSISVQDDLQQMKDAADTFVESLEGTPSRMAAFNFSTNSPSGTNSNFPELLPVSTASDADTFKAQYADWTIDSSTNWDAGMRAVAQANDDDEINPSAYDAVVFITDGNPTTSGVPGNAGGNQNFFEQVEEGIFSANTVKAQGTRSVMVGVGDGIDELTWPNLIAMSGPTQFDGDNLLETDFLTVDQFEEVGQALSELVALLCENNITVTKVIENRDGTEPPGEGWTYDAAVTDGNASIENGSQTTDDTGTVAFQLNYDEGEEQANVRITETMLDGYEPIPFNGDAADCGDATIIGSGLEDDPFVEVVAPAGETVHCEFRNRLIPAELVVDKVWEIDGETFGEGDQEPEFGAALELNDPGSDDMIPQPWGSSRSGYEVGETATGLESVTIPEECTLEAAVLERADGSGDQVPIESDEPFDLEVYDLFSEYRVTNIVNCKANLTLIKTVDNSDGGDAEPEDWVLSAEGPTPIEGVTGSDDVTDALVDVGDYVLSETGDAEGYIPGSWECVLEGTEDPINDGDQVSLERGEHVVCTITNVFVPDTGSLTLIKTVDNSEGGDAEPEDWTLSAGGPTPIEGITGTDAVTDALVEVGDYTLSESGDAVGYVPDEWECVLEGTTDVINDGDEVQVGLDEHVVCTVNNVFVLDTASLTLVKTVDNSDGGDADPQDWTLSADGPTPIEGISGSDDVTDVTVEIGDYTLSESGDIPGYVAEEWQCIREGSDDYINDGDVVPVEEGDLITCTINNVFDKEPKPTPKPDKPDPGKKKVDKGKIGFLPVTGSSLSWLLGLAALATVVGLALLTMSKRRPKTE